MSEVEVDLQEERRRSLERQEAHAREARARGLLLQRWDIGETELGEAIAARYPGMEAGEAKALLAAALKLQRTARPKVDVQTVAPRPPAIEDKKLPRVSNYAAATFEGLEAAAPPRKRQRIEAMPKKRDEVQQETSVTPVVLEVSDLRKVTPAQRSEIETITRQMMVGNHWLTPTRLIGALRREGYALKRSAASYLIQRIRYEQPVDAPDAPENDDPRRYVEPPEDETLRPRVRPKIAPGEDPVEPQAGAGELVEGVEHEAAPQVDDPKVIPLSSKASATSLLFSVRFSDLPPHIAQGAAGFVMTVERGEQSESAGVVISPAADPDARREVVKSVLAELLKATAGA